MREPTLKSIMERVEFLTSDPETKEQDLAQRFNKCYHTDAMLNHLLKQDYTLEEIVVRLCEDRQDLIKKLVDETPPTPIQIVKED